MPEALNARIAARLLTIGDQHGDPRPGIRDMSRPLL